MKHSKWLLIVVLVLIAINLSFYITWYALNVQDKIKSRLEALVGTTFNGNLKISQLSINESLITVNNLFFQHNEERMHALVKQIQIRYNLPKFIFSGFKINNVIKQIDVYQPNVYFSLHYIKPEEKRKTKIPDLTPYFDNLLIKDGKLHFNLTYDSGPEVVDTIRFSEKLRDINVFVDNTKLTSLNLSAKFQKQGSIKAISKLDKGLITLADVDINKYNPYFLEAENVTFNSSEITSHVTLTREVREREPELTINSVFKDLELEYRDLAFRFPYIQIIGNDNSLKFRSENGKINSLSFNTAGYLFGLKGSPSLNANVNITEFLLSELSPELNGTAQGEIILRGEVNNLSAEGTLHIPKAQYNNELFENIMIQSEFANKAIDFKINDVYWRNQSIDLSGRFFTNDPRLVLHADTQPFKYDEDFNLTTNIDAEVVINNGIQAALNINKLTFFNKDLSFKELNGYGNILSNTSNQNKIEFDASLTDDEGILFKSSGELSLPAIKAELQLKDFRVDEHFEVMNRQNTNSTLTGVVQGSLVGSKITSSALLDLSASNPYSIVGKIDTELTYDMEEKRGSLSFTTDDAFVKSVPFSIKMDAELHERVLRLTEFNIDDVFKVEGLLDIDNPIYSEFKVLADSASFAKYWNLFAPAEIPAPLNATISMGIDFNSNEDNRVTGYIRTDSLSLHPLKPVNVLANLSGTPSLISVDAELRFGDDEIHNIQSSISLDKELHLRSKARLTNFNFNNLFSPLNLTGNVDAEAVWDLSVKPKGEAVHTLSGRLSGTAVRLGDFTAEKIYLKATQNENLLVIDTLFVNAKNLMEVRSSGALDYNFLTNKYYSGKNYLNAAITGDIIKLAKNYLPFIESGRGRFNGQLSVRVDEDGLFIDESSLSLRNALLKLKGMPEEISDLDIEAHVDDNLLKIDKFTSQIGQGKLYVRNVIDQGDDNFFVGPVNLGYFLVRTNDNGIQTSVPDYLPPNTVATVVVKGQRSREAYIKGPFDDMKIRGEIVASNLGAVYPANTKNVLQLANVFQKQKRPEAIPLPFTLDLLIKVADNVQYVTYPANLTCLPGSFLHLIYDGNMWRAKEADIVSETGTLDFFGTIFNVETARLEINPISNMVTVNGSFLRETADGTNVTLTVTTDPTKGEDAINHLEFKLTSDNPQDKTATQILSRLRYNKNIDELSPDQRQTLLQDEAMQLIGTGVSITYVSRFLSPVENRIRRWLRLDNFSISTGFVQNLFVEFTSKDQSEPVFVDPDNLNADILQFSSSVFLNNLSVSMGKYLGRRLYVDYEILLQETTDLATETIIDLYHNASARLSLPWEWKFIYTFSIRPEHEENTHEVMLQRSFRF